MGFVFFLVGSGALFAQSDQLKAYLDRGLALSKAEKPEQALAYLLLALELGEEEFGKDSPAVVPLLNATAGTFTLQENFLDAEPLYERSLEIQERTLAQYQRGIARTLNNLGRIYESTARKDKAQALYERVLTKWQPVLGADNPSVRTARERLAELAPPPAPKVPEVKEEEPKVAAVEPPPAPAPGYRVHLTSIRNRDDADAEWARLRRVYPPLLDGWGLIVTRADLGPGKGVYFRINAGPMERDDARTLCRRFKARDVWCNVMRTEVPAVEVAAAPPKAPVPPPKPPAPPPEAPPEPEPGYQVHLTSIRNPEDAEGEWARLQRRYAPLLDGLRLYVSRVDLGADRGVWHRIKAGPLSRAGARGLCAKFAAREVWCRVVPPGNEVSGTAPSPATRRAGLRHGMDPDRRRPTAHAPIGPQIAEIACRRVPCGPSPDFSPG